MIQDSRVIAVRRRASELIDKFQLGLPEPFFKVKARLEEVDRK
jgi:hypothetical protein